MRRQLVSELTGQRGSIKTLRAGVFLMAALINGVAIGAPGDFLFRLTAPDPQSNARFGDYVRAVDGHILISEANRRYLPIDSVGRAYLFNSQSGQLLHTFNDPQPATQNRFARGIAGGDGQIFIGTIGNPESVYVFSGATGQLLRTIPSVSAESNNFGASLAYDNGNLLVAEPSFMNATGRAHLFDASTGELQRTLPNPEPKEADVFGGGDSSVALIGNKALIGASGDDLPDDNEPGGDDPGRVWVFDRTTGARELILENPNAENQVPPFFFPDSFGRRLAAGSGLIAVGAITDSTAGPVESGTVYVFDEQTGALRHTLFSPVPESRGEFGRAVAVTPWGDVLVGSYGARVDGLFQAGRAYLFDGETGTLLLDLANPDPRLGASFGWSVSATEDQILVSAVLADSNQTAGSGVVYVFEGIPEPGAVLMAAVGAILVGLLAWGVRIRTRLAACRG
jgi:outer membrane protein assembly factor BamB